ncbi:beta-1,3-galactosyltransferase 1-like [Asterias amurensis]|uniref:beta-1,3-galactosyltransferase 1-like n=1 Tax=Asterias amurensis TaxID=7602 RepID=UPI003AB2FAA0
MRYLRKRRVLKIASLWCLMVISLTVLYFSADFITPLCSEAVITEYLKMLPHQNLDKRKHWTLLTRSNPTVHHQPVVAASTPTNATNARDTPSGRESIRSASPNGTLKVTTKASGLPEKATKPPLFSDEVLNPHPFNFTLSNEDACLDNKTDKRVFLLLLVKCSPGDTFDRSLIRQTWGGVKEVDGRRTLTMFLVGESGNATKNRLVAEENTKRRDIVRENFIEAYANLTFKTLMGFKWAAQFCPDAEYVASVDADMLISVHNMVRRLVGKPKKGYAEGNLRSKVVPVRNPNDQHKKWHTSLDLYPEPTYAPFFTGACYVMSADVAARVFRESVHVRFLPWDDVYTGLVMKRVGVVPKFVRGYVQYVNLRSDGSIEGALTKGQAVISDHQHNKVDDRLVRIWKRSAARLSQIKKVV